MGSATTIRPVTATTVTNHRTNNSFGKLVAETNAAVDLIFGYTGKQLDEATGLQHNLFRWYDSNLGKWISDDPIGFAAGDENVARYTGNGPTSRVDVDGRDWDTWNYYWATYRDVVNPWDDIATPPVDGIDAVLRYGAMTGQVAAAAAITALAAVYAAPAIMMGVTTASTTVSTAVSSVAVQTQIALATPVGFWIARNGPGGFNFGAEMLAGHPGNIVPFAGGPVAMQQAMRQAQMASLVATTRGPTRSGHSYAAQVIIGGSGQAFAGHGQIRQPTTFVVAPGTSITTPRIGHSIQDITGQMMERNEWDALAQVAITNPKVQDDLVGMVTHLPGATIPNATLLAPDNLKIRLVSRICG